MARRDDPRRGPQEMVPSYSQFPFRVRHLLLPHPEKPGYMTACRGQEVSADDARWVEARRITCNHGCKGYLNL